MEGAIKNRASLVSCLERLARSQVHLISKGLLLGRLGVLLGDRFVQAELGLVLWSGLGANFGIDVLIKLALLEVVGRVRSFYRVSRMLVRRRDLRHSLGVLLTNYVDLLLSGLHDLFLQIQDRYELAGSGLRSFRADTGAIAVVIGISGPICGEPAIALRCEVALVVVRVGSRERFLVISNVGVLCTERVGDGGPAHSAVLSLV